MALHSNQSQSHSRALEQSATLESERLLAVYKRRGCLFKMTTCSLVSNLWSYSNSAEINDGGCVNFYTVSIREICSKESSNSNWGSKEGKVLLWWSCKWQLDLQIFPWMWKNNGGCLSVCLSLPRPAFTSLPNPFVQSPFRPFQGLLRRKEKKMECDLGLGLPKYRQNYAHFRPT